MTNICHFSSSVYGHISLIIQRLIEIWKHKNYFIWKHFLRILINFNQRNVKQSRIARRHFNRCIYHNFKFRPIFTWLQIFLHFKYLGFSLTPSFCIQFLSLKLNQQPIFEAFYLSHESSFPYCKSIDDCSIMIYYSGAWGFVKSLLILTCMSYNNYHEFINKK